MFDRVEQGYTYDDLQLVPGYSNLPSRQEPDISSEIVPGLKFNVPVISANMNKVTEEWMIKTMCDVGATAALHRYISPIGVADKVERLFNEGYANRFGISVGTCPNYYDEIFYSSKASEQIGFVIVDVAHGHHKMVAETIADLKKKASGIPVVAGNVATVKGAKFLIDHGASALKVGIGPGSMCTTRIVTGFGVPQLSAVWNVAKFVRDYNAFHRTNIKVIADGGIRYSGDIVKAIAAGADFVMVGNMVAGTKECPGNVLTIEGKKYKLYEGMASIDAQATFFGKEAEEIVPEGEAGMIPYKGSVYKVMKNVIGSIKHGLSYAGCSTLDDLREYGTKPENWVKNTHASMIEATPHALKR